MKHKYDFSRLIELLESKFVYASDGVELLERIESALACLEQVIQLQPELSKAIEFFEEVKHGINAAIPNDKRRF